MKRNYENQKQHLNISAYAYEIIRNDMSVFSSENTDNLSGFINTILFNAFETSPASIMHLCNRKEEELTSLIPLDISSNQQKNYAGYDAVNRFVSRILEEYKSNLASSINSLLSKKEIPINIRLNNENYALFHNPDFLEYQHYGCDFRKQSSKEDLEDYIYKKTNHARGKYLNALIEAYALTPIEEREIIYFKANYDILNMVLNTSSRNMIHITTTNDNFYIKPYSFEMSPKTHYYYLVGIEKGTGYDLDNHISMRLHSIKKIKILHKEGTISKKQEERLKQAIAERDIAYLIGPSQEYTIRLTNHGYHMYSQLLHQRPNYTKLERQDDCYILTFHCTEYQIRNYFIKFGKDAQVLFPEELRESFKSFYNESLCAYL